MNGEIAKATHGTYPVAQEIVKNVSVPYSHGSVIGKVRSGVDLSPEEQALFKGRNFKLYSRAIVGYETFTSLIHKKVKSANYHVVFDNLCTTEYASIKYGTVQFIESLEVKSSNGHRNPVTLSHNITVLDMELGLELWLRLVRAIT
ncbi:hypothetical protein ONE63_011161 [Megalurothrips usitatus]|uniref:Uncharacterized protein n=1 Tax=Megalurothrips usitatus TaxID=439358 RepID=A0AAV7X484_9NEOP|nr:hypothetical protein ONE63_011161 [Megalurothrips usitatus]